MSDTVTCTRCGQSGPAITSFIGFQGDLKDRLLQSACAPCWQEWLGYQLMAINEYRLNLGTEAHRQILAQLVSEYFKLEGATGGGEPAGDTPSLAHIDTVRTPK
ncbi:MAG: hypothetical protein AMXMBFR64_13510 [Myxococcales bacterium]